MNIGFIVGDVKSISGGSNVIFEYAHGLANRGHQITLISQIPVQPDEIQWHKKATTLSIVYLYSPEVIALPEFDCLISTWWPTTFRAPRIKAKRKIYLNQSVESRFHQEPYLKIANKASYLTQDYFVTESQWICDFIQHSFSIPANKVCYIQNKLNSDFFPKPLAIPHRVKAEHLRVLVEGPWNVPFKRVPETFALLNSFAPIQGIEFGWLTSQPSPTPPTVWGTPVEVFTKIPFDRVHQVYRQFDVLLKFSTVEGMFGPPLEMFSQGGTAITNFVSGSNEYMRNYFNGIQLRDFELSRLNMTLQQLLTSDDLLLHLKRNALITADSFYGWESSVQQLNEWLISLPPVETGFRQNQQVIAQMVESYIEKSSLTMASERKTSARIRRYLMRIGFVRFIIHRIPLSYKLKLKAIYDRAPV